MSTKTSHEGLELEMMEFVGLGAPRLNLTPETFVTTAGVMSLGL